MSENVVEKERKGPITITFGEIYETNDKRTGVVIDPGEKLDKRNNQWFKLGWLEKDTENDTSFIFNPVLATGSDLAKKIGEMGLEEVISAFDRGSRKKGYGPLSEHNKEELIKLSQKEPRKIPRTKF